MSSINAMSVSRGDFSTLDRYAKMAGGDSVHLPTWFFEGYSSAELQYFASKNEYVVRLGSGRVRAIANSLSEAYPKIKEGFQRMGWNFHDSEGGMETSKIADTDNYVVQVGSRYVYKSTGQYFYVEREQATRFTKELGEDFIREYEPTGKLVHDSQSVKDGSIVAGEGRSMDGIPFGVYVQGGKRYRGFEITSEENGLRKGVYRFYNWGNSSDRTVSFGNSARDGQFLSSDFERLVGEGKIKLLDSVSDASNFTKKTKQGYDIIETYGDGGRHHIIFKRANDYGVGLGYNDRYGEWAQGMYDFGSVEAARRALIATKPYALRLSDSFSLGDAYNRYANETDITFLNEALKEMRRYESNWSFMSAKEKRNIAPEGGLSELRTSIKQCKDRIRVLEKKDKAIVYAPVVDEGVSLTNLPDSISREEFDKLYFKLRDLVEKKWNYRVSTYGDRFKIEVEKAVGATQGSYGPVGGQWKVVKTIYCKDATRKSLIEKLRTVSVPYGERYQVTDGSGWSFDLQHHGRSTYEEITKYPRVSPKESSLATLRFWYNGTFMAKFEGPINKVKADGIAYLKTQLKDSETVGELDLDTLPSEDGEQKVKLHTGGKVIEIEVESEEREREEHMGDSAVHDAKSIRASSISVGRKLVGDENEIWTVTSVKKGGGGIDVAVKNDKGEKDNWYFEANESVPIADGKKPFAVKDAKGKEYLVYAEDSDAAVKKIRGLKDAAYTVTARTNDFPYGNNLATIVNATSESEAVAKYRKVLEARGDKINSISARPTTASDEAKGISRLKDSIVKDYALSFYIDVPKKSELMSMSDEKFSDFKRQLARAKNMIPFSNQVAWNKISTLTEWIREREAKNS